MTPDEKQYGIASDCPRLHMEPRGIQIQHLGAKIGQWERGGSSWAGESPLSPPSPELEGVAIVCGSSGEGLCASWVRLPRDLLRSYGSAAVADVPRCPSLSPHARCIGGAHSK